MPEETVRLRNRRQQPVELHLPTGVLVLPPGGEAQVAPSVLATPQVALLLARRALDTELSSPTASPRGEANAAEAASTDDGSPAPTEGISPAATPSRAGDARRGRRAPKP